MLRKILIGLALLLTPVCASAQQKVIPYVGNAPWSNANPAPFSATVTATNDSVGVNGAANPADSTQVGMSDGTNLQKWLAAIALADGVNGNNSGAVVPWVFNGATFDRQFTCASSAVVSVTAANTTEIIALSSGKVIRVCSIAISMTAAGTAQIVTGTGTNCGTGTASLTAAMTLATGIPLTISSGTGSLLRTPASNALCVVAATGNVVGFITYAQY